MTGSQLAGFLSGLAQFTDWPIKTREILTVISDGDHMVVEETTRRLAQQKLLDFRAPNLTPSLCLPDDRHGLFFAVLPLVKYDSRVARFLSEPSSSPNITLIKVQLASVLTIGTRRLVSVNHEKAKVDAILDAAGCGLTGPYVGFGNIWLYLGFIKQAVVNNHQRQDWITDTMTEPTYHLADKAVAIDLEAMRNFVRLNRELNRVLTSFRVPVPNMPIQDEMGYLEHDEFTELLWHLLCAFIHQTAVTVEPVDEDEQLPVQDLVSYQSMSHNGALAYIDWEVIRDQDKDFSVSVGFYTSLDKHSKDVIVTAEDWNWIPGKILQRWWREFAPLEALRCLPPLGSNDDEA